MLFLSSKDIDELIDCEDVLKSIEKSYCIHYNNKFLMPDRMHVHSDDTTLLLMPCFVESCFGTKLVTVNKENANIGVPVINGVMVLNDNKTGEPLAVLNAASLTGYRTGAVGGVGIKYTTPDNVESVGLVGAGVQGFYQLLYACAVRNIKRINIYDLNKKALIDFKNRLLKKLPDVNIHISDSVEEMLFLSEVVICTTSSTKAVLPNDENLLKAKHFIGIGSYKPNMREFPDSLYPLLKNVYVDTPFASSESGDLSQPLAQKLINESQILNIDKFVDDKEYIVEETSLFKSVGMALFDVVVADYLYKNAVKLGKGTEVKL